MYAAVAPPVAPAEAPVASEQGPWAPVFRPTAANPAQDWAILFENHTGLAVPEGAWAFQTGNYGEVQHASMQPACVLAAAFHMDGQI